MSHISIHDVGKVFHSGGQEVCALEAIDLEIRQGEFVCLLGPSGCGKSTLLNAVAGFSPPTTGTITVDGSIITDPGPDRGMVFQEYALFPWMTVEQNIAFGLQIKKVAKHDPMCAAEGAIIFIERVSAALEQVDSSSGAIGSAVNHAVADLAEIIGGAQVDGSTRRGWLEWLWLAYVNDQIPYIESLGDHWGELCATKEIASEWADRLVDGLRENWTANPRKRGYYIRKLVATEATGVLLVTKILEQELQR